MPTEPELLQAVLAKPDDDAPRLEYAKWCEAQTDETTRQRGAMIRLQIAAFRAGETIGGREAEAHKLIEKYRARWDHELRSIVSSVSYHRGFAELVALPAARWPESGRKIRALAPVRHLDFVPAKPGWAEALASESLRGIRSLGVNSQQLDDADVALLAASLHVLELRWLSLGGNRVGEDGAVALAQSRGLPSLRWVNFYANPFNPGEEYSHDQGAIVESWLPPEGEALEKRFGRLEWLHHPAHNLWDTIPDRFTLPAA